MAMYLGNIPVVTVNDLPYMHTEIVEAFVSRQTANGMALTEPSPAIVEMIKGRTVKSTNLARNEYSTITDGENGILFKRVKGTSYFQVYGTPTAAGGRTVFKTTIAKAGRYTLSVPNLPILRLELLRNGVAFLTMWKRGGTQNSAASASFNITEDNTVFEVSAVANTDDTLGTESNPTTIELMLTEGETGYVDYKPYFSGLKHANFKGIKSTGKNLIPFPYHDSSKVMRNVSFTVQEDGGIYIKGNTDIELYFNLQRNASCKDLNATTKPTDGKVYLSATTNLSYSQARLLVNAAGTIFIAVQPNVDVDGVVYPMLNFGDTAQPYEPYKAEEYGDGNTYELPEYDYINPQTGEYTKGTKYYIFTGNENWDKSPIATSGKYRNRLTTLDAINNSSISAKPPLICNLYDALPSASGGTYYANRGVSFSSGNFDVYDKDYATVDVSLWKAHLAELYASGNPLVIVYELKTPTIETLTGYPKGYQAKNGGSETVEQGDTDNSQWGAIPTTTINYREKLTGNTFFTVPIIKRYGKNLFNAKEINITSYKINEDGSAITVPLTTSGDGIYGTGSTFRRLCPEVKVGDILYLRFDREYVNGGEIDKITNKMIYFDIAKYIWYQTVALNVTEEILNSKVSLYGNRFINGETEQVILKNFRVVKNPNDEFEPYKEPWYEY